MPPSHLLPLAGRARRLVLLRYPSPSLGRGPDPDLPRESGPLGIPSPDFILRDGNRRAPGPGGLVCRPLISIAGRLMGRAGGIEILIPENSKHEILSREGLMDSPRAVRAGLTEH